MTYVTSVDKTGSAASTPTKTEYKIIYLFTDKIVFYKTEEQKPMLKNDDLSHTSVEMETNIERIIYFGEIMLQCGGSYNKLCHAGQLPNFEKLNSYNTVKTVISDAKVLCIVIPFYENAYKDKDQKLAYICETSTSKLSEFLKFKNLISRKIEKYQFLLSMDRFNGIHGILRKTENFITVFKKSPLNVIGKIYDKGIIIVKNEKSQEFVRYYSFYQQRTEVTGVSIVKDVQGTDMLPPNWWNGLEDEPTQDNCCMYFKGDSDSMFLCLADSSGKKIESSSDVCDKKLKESFKEASMSISNIKLYEANYELLTNKKKLENCDSEEYKFLKKRIETSADYSIRYDCQTLVQYSNEETNFKLDFCRKYYMDELELEIIQITLSTFEVSVGVKKCVMEKHNLYSKSILDGKNI
jgi:hypothetical protein